MSHVGWQKQKNKINAAQFQDMEDPEYEDFRTEAMLQRQRQQECFEKAAEAYRQGRKDVASFYAQQVLHVLVFVTSAQCCTSKHC